MSKDISLNAILGDFKASREPVPVSAAIINVRVPPAVKARYDKLQLTSGREFGRRVRETVLKLIDLAEAHSA